MNEIRIMQLYSNQCILIFVFKIFSAILLKEISDQRPCTIEGSMRLHHPHTSKLLPVNT